MTPFERNLKIYPKSSYTLLPLHKPTDSKTKNGRTILLGKAPIHRNWTKATYDYDAVIKRCVSEKRNAGVRLRESQVVIDIDPRNGGDVSYLEMFAEYGIDENIFPRVITGSGGLHLYATKPKDIPILDTLGEQFPGVEFKSKGRQVVAAGSIHPETKQPYAWAKGFPPIEDAPALPAKLLNLIRKPLISSKLSGGGQYDQEEIAAMLEHLDARDFNQHTKWLNMMMACHHASNGDARSEFIEWSITDPDFAKDAEAIGRRWDSLHRNKANGIKAGTLDMYMRQAGATNAIPNKVKVAADEFDDPDVDTSTFVEGDEDTEPDFDFDDPDTNAPKEPAAKKDKKSKGGDPEDAYEPEALSALETLNTRYTWIMDGSTPQIYYRRNDPVMEREFFAKMNPQSFCLHYGNKRIERDTKALGLAATAATTIQLGKAWCEWPRRSQAEGLVFYPRNDSMPGYLNLWSGFNIDASVTGGSWAYLRELIHEVICNGNDEHYEYLIRWCAFMMQTPERSPETTVVIRGQKGTGKGTLGKTLCKIIGRHALQVNSAAQLTGRFNAHLQDCVFLFADEAILPYDKQAENVLKGLITEQSMTVEKKGIDLTDTRNFLHILMASNDKWVIPASFEERRFFMTEANNKRIQQHSFFEKLYDELAFEGDKGYHAFMHHLLTLELPPRWHPRSMPMTTSLIDQKIRAMGPLATFFYNAICRRDFGSMPTHPERGWDWQNKPIRFFVEDFKRDFGEFCRGMGINAGNGGRSNFSLLLQDIKELFPTARVGLRDLAKERMDIGSSPSDGRAPAIEIPSRPDCMAAYEANLGGVPTWPDLEDKGTIRRKPLKEPIAGHGGGDELDFG